MYARGRPSRLVETAWGNGPGAIPTPPTQPTRVSTPKRIQVWREPITVGTVAACGFGGVLYKVLTSDAVLRLLTDILRRALTLSF